MKEQTKMKSDDTLVRLAQNPHYKMSDAEVERLEQIGQDEPRFSSVSVDSKKKQSQTTLGSATVKETGKLNKHPSDPVRE